LEHGFESRQGHRLIRQNYFSPHLRFERLTDQAIIAQHPQETRLSAAPRWRGGHHPMGDATSWPDSPLVQSPTSRRVPRRYRHLRCGAVAPARVGRAPRSERADRATPDWSSDRAQPPAPSDMPGTSSCSWPKATWRGPSFGRFSGASSDSHGTPR